jgi:eukaryotic-like serine/threonine-protein kinase
MGQLERLTAALADRYRIERELGAGGMATVYLASDLKHDRNVAIKVLHPDLGAALGADRFLTEIKTTAKLQHPHILPLLDSGDAGGLLYYVMPVMTGETLRGRLTRERQLPIPEAVRIAREVASALDYAHRQGVIHRDIKPENILLHDGQALVADFGIALAVQQAGGARMTQTGLSLGTPSYMSPEQAMGERTIDLRSDIYSLGALTYEMLAGDPPFTGSTVQAIVARVLSEKPTPLHTLRDTVPPGVEHAVMTALAKLPADRFENAKQFADALTSPTFATVAAGAPQLTARGWLRDPRSWAALLVSTLLAVFALTRGNDANDSAPTPVMRFTVEGPTDSAVLAIGAARGGNPIVTRDGRIVAFVARKAAGQALYVRRLETFELSEIADDVQAAFFSPDNASIGFFSNSGVWKADLREPVPVRVGVIPENTWDIRSAAWHADGRILIAASRGLWTIPATGGQPELLLAADATGRELFEHVDVLDDGRIIIVVSADTVVRIEVLSADGNQRRRILPGFDGVQVVDDVMVYGQEGQLRATFFDARTLQPTGKPIVLPDVPIERGLRPGRSIAFADSLGVRDLEPVWVTTNGTVTQIGLPRSQYRWLRVSPDLGRVATGSFETLYSFALRTGTRTRIMGGSEPVWSTDGRYVFASRGNRPLGGIVRQIADGSRAADTLLVLDKGDAWPTDASPDGRLLAYYGATYGTGDGEAANDPGDVMFLDLTTRRSRRLSIPGAQRGARFSPDGKWIAYQSTEAGAEEVFVRPWPQLDAKYQISSGGGTEPLWARDSRTLYYRHRDEVIEVPVAIREGAIERGAPRVLFAGSYATDQSGDQSWDIASDGRFLMLRPLPGERIDIRVTLNWIADVRQRLQRAQ